MKERPTNAASAATDELFARLSKPTKRARERAEGELSALMLDDGNWVDGAERFAAPLLTLVEEGGTAAAPAMRLLGHLVSEGDRAISTGPVPTDPLLSKIDPEYVRLLKSAKMRKVRSALADGVASVVGLLASKDAETRASAGYLLANIPEAISSRAKLDKAIAAETDKEVAAALTFASGFFARHSKKKATPAAKASIPVRAAATLAAIVAGEGKLETADREALLAAIPAPELSPAKFPWRNGCIDRVISNVVGNALGRPLAATLVAQSVSDHPDHERSIHWAAAALVLGFPEREDLVHPDELSDEQRTLLAQISVRDWQQLNTEFRQFGLPPHARDRLALLVSGASTESSILERKVETPKGEKTLLAVLEGFEKADATFEDRHAFLSKVLTPGEHLEVCRLAAEQAMGLNDLGDAGAIAVARGNPAACASWAEETIRGPKPSQAARGDLWLTLALMIEISNKTRTAIEPALDSSIYADARGGAMAETVLAALPVPRREALLASRIEKDVMTNLVAFVPLVHVCPTPKIIKLFLQVTDPKALTTAFGKLGAKNHATKKVLPFLPGIIASADASSKNALEARAAELTAIGV